MLKVGKHTSSLSFNVGNFLYYIFFYIQNGRLGLQKIYYLMWAFDNLLFFPTTAHLGLHPVAVYDILGFLPIKNIPQVLPNPRPF